MALAQEGSSYVHLATFICMMESSFSIRVSLHEPVPMPLKEDPIVPCEVTSSHICAVAAPPTKFSSSVTHGIKQLYVLRLMVSRILL